VARQHAAETSGSFIMRTILRELTQKSEKYDYILSNCIVKLVPMINPDGVTIGNSRTSLVGVDLNRRWGDPNSLIHPEIFFLKASMQIRANH
jgi:murein tripeptide amidase MpaA